MNLARAGRPRRSVQIGQLALDLVGFGGLRGEADDVAPTLQVAGLLQQFTVQLL